MEPAETKDVPTLRRSGVYSPGAYAITFTNGGMIAGISLSLAFMQRPWGAFVLRVLLALVALSQFLVMLWMTRWLRQKRRELRKEAMDMVAFLHPNFTPEQIELYTDALMKDLIP